MRVRLGTRGRSSNTDTVTWLKQVLKQQLQRLLEPAAYQLEKGETRKQPNLTSHKKSRTFERRYAVPRDAPFEYAIGVLPHHVRMPHHGTVPGAFLVTSTTRIRIQYLVL